MSHALDRNATVAAREADDPLLTRRSLVLGLPVMLAACQTPVRQELVVPPSPPVDPMYVRMYAAMPHEEFPIPAVDVSAIDPIYLRQVVPYHGPEHPGTIVVDPHQRFLYLVRDDGTAMRYGVGVGREGFAWSGRANIQMKRKWPTWTPPAAMIRRQPELEPYRHGMKPGLDNPLGSRALYLFQGGRDTLYRLHGTNEPWSIGRSLSSGCIRLFNQDIIDLYDRVPVGTPVLVRD